MAAISGGDRLKAALDKIAAKLDKGGTVKVGFLAGSTSTDGQSIPLRAALNEFGHEHNGVVTPPRPFFRNMLAAKADSWPDAIALNLKANNYDVDKTLHIVGEGIKGQLTQSILDFTDPPLSPVTIARKGHSQPLIETGDMIRAIAAAVKTK